jgi:hypothetical protein
LVLASEDDRLLRSVLRIGSEDRVGLVISPDS